MSFLDRLFRRTRKPDVAGPIPDLQTMADAFGLSIDEFRQKFLGAPPRDEETTEVLTEPESSRVSELTPEEQILLNEADALGMSIDEFRQRVLDAQPRDEASPEVLKELESKLISGLTPEEQVLLEQVLLTEIARLHADDPDKPGTSP